MQLTQEQLAVTPSGPAFGSPKSLLAILFCNGLPYAVEDRMSGSGHMDPVR